MKTKRMHIYERSRLWRAQDDEKFALELTLFGSQKEIEKVRTAVFNCEEGKPGNV